MPQTKYGFEFSNEVVLAELNRLTNQIWKLIPMRENNEDWIAHLDAVILEIAGLNEVFSPHVSYLRLLVKLEGLKNEEVDFEEFRKSIFKSIRLLRGLCDYE